MPETDNISTLDLIKRTIARKVSLYTTGRTADEIVLPLAQSLDLNQFEFTDRDGIIYFRYFRRRYKKGFLSEWRFI